MALVNELKLESDEITAGQKRMKHILSVYRKGEWTKEEIKYHFGEWEAIAKRIKKGSEMLDSMKAVRPESIEHLNKLQSLYTYLMKMLGIYDSLFKFMYRMKEEYYFRAREAILTQVQ